MSEYLIIIEILNMLFTSIKFYISTYFNKIKLLILIQWI